MCCGPEVKQEDPPEVFISLNGIMEQHCYSGSVGAICTNLLTSDYKTRLLQSTCQALHFKIDSEIDVYAAFNNGGLVCDALVARSLSISRVIKCDIHLHKQHFINGN